jgi:Sortase domain
VRIRVPVALVLALVAVLLAGPATSPAAEPPNQNDPCASGGRNTCDTTGVGSYERYQYGLRWFGDFRGAVEGEVQTFCIDLRFWYPSKSYRFTQMEAGPNLRNREGKAIPVRSQQKMAYAIWNYGRTSDRDRQAAMMLYVHSLMNDGEPGEADWGALGPGTEARIQRIEREAARFHGPYRIETKISDDLRVAKKASGTIRILSAAGNPLPNTDLTIAAKGVNGIPKRVTTNGAGVARITFTPTAVGDLELQVRSETVASTLPQVYRPSTAAAARNGQRLAAPDSQQVQAEVARPVAQGRIGITTQATPDKMLLGESNSDKVTIRGIPDGTKVPVTVNLHGPFRSVAEVKCDGAPLLQSSLVADGSGTSTTASFVPPKPGFYTYQLIAAGDANLAGITTPCGEPSETFKVEVQPAVSTVVNAPTVRPGTAIFDNVKVTGLAGEPAVVQAALYGPFSAPDKIVCTGAPVWTGTLNVPGDGDYVTAPFTLAVAGYYTYQETIVASEFVRTAVHPCGEATQTAIALGAPKVVTQISDQEAAPGVTITDSVAVSGLGALSATVQVQLWGPYATRPAVNCVGTPFWTGSFVAEGDGTYTTEGVKLDAAGYYTYREDIVGTGAHDAAATACGEATETIFVKAQPSVTTIVSDAVVRPGSEIFDRIRVKGLGKTSALIDVELFGPFTRRDAMRCTGEPFWKGRVTATGDGEIRSPAVKVAKAGFYTYREKLIGSDVVTGTTTECGLAVETSLAAPGIATGRSEGGGRDAGRTQGSGAARVRIASLNIDTRVAPVDIDIAKGVLDVPANIQRAGWWRDGASPGDKAGAVLIAGHVDSARRGAGAFFRLKNVSGGAIIQVTSGDGKTRSYRVVSVREYPKAALPLNIYSTTGAPRLVLVTCGGPFDAAAGAYRDNIVVTAVPA